MTVHVIGGGLAGLAAALECAHQGIKVALYEAAPDLGGRARTYFSNELNAHIDNGAHAVLGNNKSIQRYLGLCGSSDSITVFGANGLTFYDVRSHSTSKLKLPSVLWSSAHRPPGVSMLDLLAGLKLLTANAQSTAADALRASPQAVAALWEPLCISALNTPLAEASAASLGVILKQMALPGGLGAGLLLPKQSLTDTYIAPIQKWLQRRGVDIRRGAPLRQIAHSNGHVTNVVFDDAAAFEADDVVILALPPWSPLLNEIGIPTAQFSYAPIVNGHFKLPRPVAPQFIGLIGGQGQWVLVRDGIASVTVSAADALNTQSPDAIAQTLWAEIAPLLKQPEGLPPFHVIKERRATLRHVPGLDAQRPATVTPLKNLFLAGDWTATGLPCTLESAVHSGFGAAHCALREIKRL
jgi:squalene-associated FAD-dependent desaturase